jgi:hypothetical protein
VLRQFTCPDCRRKGDWKPVNTAIKYITNEALVAPGAGSRRKDAI